jgi:hypothetical protein
MAYNRTIMLPRYHIEMTRRALGEHFSGAALQKIIVANLYQDRLTAQYGHDEFHFDNNSFEKSYAYIEGQRLLVISALESNNPASAWSAFGRLTHTAQDFYAHSNYISLWVARQPGGTVPAPAEVDPVDGALLNSPALHSGKLYYPLELLSFAKFLRPLVMPLLPGDSHAWMNLDSPARGPNFAFAYHAALKRTRIELDKTVARLAADQLAMFLNKNR